MIETLLVALVPALLKAAAAAIDAYRQGQVDHATILAQLEQALADAQSLLGQAKASHLARVAELNAVLQAAHAAATPSLQPPPA